MSAAHILVRLTKEAKTHEEIAREHFDNNLELVNVWKDYMAAINWIYKDAYNNNKWIRTNYGKKWVEKMLQHKFSEDRRTYRV